MSDEELETHEWLKDFFGFRGLYGEDSQTIKQAERMSKKVLLLFFGNELKEIFQRKSKDELARFRAEMSQKTPKGNTSTPENETKGMTKP